MVTTRRGIGRLGCLVFLLIAAAGLNFGVGIGEAYWRYFRYRDAMTQAARFAGTTSDEAIRARLAATADSLGLPPEAQKVTIRRAQAGVAIEARYTELVELPGTVRELQFHPQAERK